MSNKPLPSFTNCQRKRFWLKVARDDVDSCWLWQGWTKKDRNGTLRGRVSVGSASNRSYFYASRVAYFLVYNEDPGELEVCHSCDNTLCTNPAHLWIGTHAENMADMSAKGRGLSRSGPGILAPSHKLTEDQVRQMRHTSGTQREIAQAFDVSQAAVSLVINGRTWGHIS